MRTLITTFILLCSCMKEVRPQGNSGQTLPESNTDRTTVCAGVFLRGSCPTGEVIAVKGVKYGTKLISTCPLSSTTAGCCDYDATDCFDPPYTGTTQQEACSGRELCNDVSVGQEDTSVCGATYHGLNHYLTMEYYCIPDSRIGSSSSATLEETGNLLYLKNMDYPGHTIRPSETRISCSVETTTCTSQVSVYFVHFELSDGGSCSGTQNIQIGDKGVTHTYTCSDNTDYNITQKLTSTSNYLSITLNNPGGTASGKFWIGFEATDGTARIKLSCPAQSQTVCMDCPALSYPANGQVSPTTTVPFGQSATYTCTMGYTVVGFTTRTCQMDGSWSGSEPTCGITDPTTSEFTRPSSLETDTTDSITSESTILPSLETDTTVSSTQPVSTTQLGTITHPATVARVGIQPEIAVQTGCEYDRWDITVNFGVLKILYSNITKDNIYLGVSSCVGRSHSDLLLFQQSFNSCSTTVMTTNTSVVYQNTLIYAEHDPVYTFIVRRLIWDLPVKCQVPRVLVANASIHHDGHHLHESIVTPPPAHTPISLQFFRDKRFLHPIPGSSLHVNVGDLVYVKVLAVTQTMSERLVLRSCYMRPTADAPDTKKYYIIRNGCATDANTSLISRSQHETRFSFREFEYSTNHEGLKIYCEAFFCEVKDTSSRCVTNCATNNNPAIIG